MNTKRINDGLSRSKRLYIKRVSNGLCEECGNSRGEKGTSTRCFECAERRRLYRRTRYVHRPRKLHGSQYATKE